MSGSRSSTYAPLRYAAASSNRSQPDSRRPVAGRPLGVHHQIGHFHQTSQLQPLVGFALPQGRRSQDEHVAFAHQVVGERKYVYGKTREQVHSKWLALRQRARQGPVATSVPSLGEFLTYWLDEVVKPNLAPLTHATYETFARRYITPRLGPNN